MTTFTSLVSKFAHEQQRGESSRSNNNPKTKTNSDDDDDDKKRKIESEEEESKDLETQVRKSQRLSTSSVSVSATTSTSTSTSKVRLLNSRVVSADSIKSRPHHKRVVTERSRGSQSRLEYAPPEVYAHLNIVPDIIDYDLDVLFVGINPG
ncbi:hypothetical protein BGZ65_008938, partial [Modicella reniformis]